MQDDVSRLVGLDGLVVTGVADRGWWLEVEVELAGRAACCRWCGRGSLTVKDRHVVRIRDLPIAGRVTYLLWRKRRYRCAGCERTFSETHPELPARQQVTRRFREHLFERVRGGAAHAEVAREEHTTRYQVQTAFVVGGDELQARRDHRGPRRLSLDEAQHRRRHELATVVSDLDRRRVIEVLDGARRKVIERWLAALPDHVRAGIEVVAIDPSNPYRQAIQTALPDARIICDRFHLIRGANTALDSVRRERQRQARAAARRRTRQSRPPDRWRPELYHARHRLLKARERLTSQDERRLAELFASDPMIAQAWALKEAFRSIYQATSRQHAEQRLDEFLAAVDRADLPPFHAFARTVRQWRTELLGYFDEPTTNGYAEGVINKVKVIKRRAYGLPTFTSFRKRILLACG
jgi:transposase